ncbi:MAG: AAA family ATPase [Ktedonobacterales bacterium]
MATQADHEVVTADQGEVLAPTVGLDPFEQLYRQPELQAMRKLSPANFERFVAHVLSHAGYRVTHTGPFFRRGVDLELLPNEEVSRKRLGGVECKRYNGNQLVGRDPVQKLAGAAALKTNLPGYLITTSGFTEPAQEEARQHSNISLLDGGRFVRYVNYIRGSVGQTVRVERSPIPPNAVIEAERIVAQRAQYGPRVLVIANNKGGVGKTTTARFLGIGLAEHGRHVLLIDMDAQANLSEFILGTGPDKTAPPNLADYFSGVCRLPETVHSSPTQPLLSIIPAHPSLAHADTGGFGRPDIELKFVANLYDAFAPREGFTRYDWIIIDTPPNVSLFTRAALAAADFVLAPVRARESSVRGTINMLYALRAMSALMGRTPQLLGGLLTHWGEDTASENAEARLGDVFHNERTRLLDPRIPMSAAIESNPNAARNARLAYDQVVEEVLKHDSLS